MNMIKKVKKFEKWLLLVLISFCVLFTAISIDGMGLASAIGFELDEDNIVNMSVEEIKQIASDCEESIALQTEGIKNDNETNYGKAYQEYPLGTYTMMKEFARIKSHSDTLIVSLILGLLVGTGIFFVIDEDKKGVKLLIIFYILSIFLLGFLEGIDITGESLLDRWLFPVTYFIPATLMYGVVIVFIGIKQQNLAMELNKKLEEEKKRTQTENNDREETFLERTKETREKMAKVGSVVIEIIMILIVFIYFICA